MTVSGLIPVAETFEPPGPGAFELPPFFGDSYLFTKPAFQLVLAAVLVLGFFAVTTRRMAMVPSKGQYLGEQAYGFVRNSIARDVIGSKDFMPFVPWLVATFFFIVINNVFGIVPFIQFPTFSRANFAYGMSALVWLLYNGLGVRKHGFSGYLKHVSVPSGVSGPILLLLVPLEFISNVLVRPFTLALRLFANMFAGHLLLILFATGGEYLLLEAGNVGYKPVGVLAIVLAIAISFLELLVQFLQAYVFTLLTAIYIQGAIAEEH
ncbi:MAG: ATP synthase F0 sector subunit a [uncultured Nocardioidaceae bacterium]|uniref:ATP synthase subunit a n=1 Tax=uncultured Nocardioidaceae bacterium TaxID=253824 RepID=A0A6J4N1X4_9ACTN|nr:MAG: ATP synthase F0 sector subunit a [uncultured Nocardioidaceae bacterium]